MRLAASAPASAGVQPRRGAARRVRPRHEGPPRSRRRLASVRELAARRAQMRAPPAITLPGRRGSDRNQSRACLRCAFARACVRPAGCRPHRDRNRPTGDGAGGVVKRDACGFIDQLRPACQGLLEELGRCSTPRCLHGAWSYQARLVRRCRYTPPRAGTWRRRLLTARHRSLCGPSGRTGGSAFGCPTLPPARRLRSVVVFSSVPAQG